MPFSFKTTRFSDEISGSLYSKRSIYDPIIESYLTLYRPRNWIGFIPLIRELEKLRIAFYYLDLRETNIYEARKYKSTSNPL